MVKPSTAGGRPFVVHTVGANRHSWRRRQFEGQKRPGNIKTDGGGTCTLVFGAKPDSIQVTVKNTCQGFCGARATLDGMFLKPAPGCDRANVRRARAELKRLYDKKAYRKARVTLERSHACTKNTGWRRGRLGTHDLAITFLRLGDPAA